jgi:hypothetical protein
MVIGRGGITRASQATGISRHTVTAGCKELREQSSPQSSLPATRIRKAGGGSNGSRVRLWKTELQQLANETGLIISVCHFPPGTSKWNKIEHRLFSYISQNWRGKPLVSHEVIVNLISGTKTKTGL